MILKYSCIVLVLISATFSQSEFKNITIAKYDPIPVAVHIEQNAEYVIAELSIQNDDKDPIRRYEILERVIYDLKLKAKMKEYVSLILLPVNLSIEKGKLNSKFRKSIINYRILISLKYFKYDFFSAVIALREFVDDLSSFEDTEYLLSSVELAIDEPERFREDILKNISNELKKLKTLFGENTQIMLTGLENPVTLVQLNNIRIALYINYQIKLKHIE